MATRPFRTEESRRSERTTRAMVVPFLEMKGLVVEEDRRERQGQTVIARFADSAKAAMRVKLCWRRDGHRESRGRSRSYAATQLMARVSDGDWIGSLSDKMSREAAHGVSHLLIVQRDADHFAYAAVVPLGSVVPIWEAQRDESERLITAGALGNRRKNHAMNGSSPTLWLQDDQGQSVADALWKFPGVIDIGSLPDVDRIPLTPEEVGDAETYTEGGVRRVTVNAYERDRKARIACISEFGVDCFICGFNFGTRYGSIAEGHIHVHHLRPISEVGSSYKIDPIEDLRPLCPNCHAVVHMGGECRDLDQVRSMITQAGHLPK